MAKHNYWSDDEIRWLLENYSTTSWEYILSQLSRSKQDIISKAHELGVKRAKVAGAMFSDQEDELIKKYLPTMTCSEFQKKYLSHRTTGSINCRARRLHVVSRLKWTEDEDNFLKENYIYYSTVKLSEILEGRSREAIYNRLKKLGLTEAPAFAYSEADIQFIKENYLNLSDKEIGEKLHRAGQSIKEFRRKLNLRRPQRTIDYSINEFLHGQNKQWRVESIENCGRRCVITGKDFDDVHHLYSKNNIVKDVLDKLNIDRDKTINDLSQGELDNLISLFKIEQAKYPLGVCLSHDIHMDFHNRYGYGSNTPEQFYEYVKSVAPDRLNIIMSL